MIQAITVTIPEDEIVKMARKKFVNEIVDLNSDHRTDHYMYENLMEMFTVCDITWDGHSLDVVLEKQEG